MAARTALIAMAALVGAAGGAGAHPLAPSLLELREAGAGRFEVELAWARSLPQAGAPAPRLPGHCRWVGEPRIVEDAARRALRSRADCGAAGLVGGRVGVEGLAEGGRVALLRIQWADGRTLRAVLEASSPDLRVPARESRLLLAGGYLALGARHIATGADHLLFVLGLLLLVSGRRALVLAVSAFTLGHSATLSLAVLGLFRVPPALAELAIAASLLVLAVELARGADGAAPRSRLRRRPWEVAALFGLVHGLGFAGALAEAGVPDGEIPLALLSFNLGIELGQLAFVACALGLLSLLQRTAPLPAYLMGSLAAFWCFARLAPLL